MAEAYFEIDAAKVLEQYDLIREKTNADRVVFSTKTNYTVAQILAEHRKECHFSVHLLSEAEKTSNKRQILFFLQGTTSDELLALINHGVTSFVVDNPVDLETVKTIIQHSQVPITLFLRMRLAEKTIKTGHHFVYGFLSDGINRFIPELKKLKGIQTLGIHFHRKTQNINEWSYAFELGQILSRKTLDCIDVVNIGGGFPCVYKNYSVDVSESVFAKVRELKQWLEQEQIELWIEPGRFIAGPSTKLFCSIILVYKDTIVINASIYNGALDTYIVNTRLLVEGEVDEKNGRPFTIKGITPDSRDIFRYRVYLKDTPRIGDTLVFLNAGAYNFSTDFCSLKPLKTVVI